MANGIGPDQTLLSAVSDLDLHYLLRVICLGTLGKYPGKIRKVGFFISHSNAFISSY